MDLDVKQKTIKHLGKNCKRKFGDLEKGKSSS